MLVKTHRFGLLTPSSNTTQEPELAAALPPTMSLHTGRVSYRDITPQEQMRCIEELEAESRKLADADAILMPGGNWPAMTVVQQLEQELGKPVLANNAVSLWAGLRLLKMATGIPGYGRLLREHLRHEPA